MVKFCRGVLGLVCEGVCGFHPVFDGFVGVFVRCGLWEDRCQVSGED